MNVYLGRFGCPVQAAHPVAGHAIVLLNTTLLARPATIVGQRSDVLDRLDF
jgi:hypothetical protein